jgi:hypothetical protein
MRRNSAKPEPAQIEHIDNDRDRPNRVVVTDPVFQPIRKTKCFDRDRRLGVFTWPGPRAVRRRHCQEDWFLGVTQTKSGEKRTLPRAGLLLEAGRSCRRYGSNQSLSFKRTLENQ